MKHTGREKPARKKKIDLHFGYSVSETHASLGGVGSGSILKSPKAQASSVWRRTSKAASWDNQDMVPSGPTERRGKPIDRWLGLGSAVVGLVFYLVLKTPGVVVSALVLIFALSIHPIWNFWWIEAKLWRKVSATALLVLALFGLGQISWPPDSGSFLQAISHVFAIVWRWLLGLHGRWFDRARWGCLCNWSYAVFGSYQ